MSNKGVFLKVRAKHQPTKYKIFEEIDPDTILALRTTMCGKYLLGAVL
jgi:hypothetical protein